MRNRYCYQSGGEKLWISEGWWFVILSVAILVCQRRIPHLKVRRLVKFDRNALNQWLKEQTRMPMPRQRSVTLQQ